MVVFTVAGSLALMNAAKKTEFTPQDKAYYASSALVNFVRPGLTIKIVSASIATDGTIQVDYKISDPKGLPLDLSGVTTPGTMSVSFLAAYIPRGQTEFYSYITRTQTSSITKNSAVQAAADSGGTTAKVADGEYLYTFKTKAAGSSGAAWDPTLTHRIGVYGSRNLTEFDLGTNYDDDTYTFVPNGSAVTTVRDIVRTDSCNQCHDQLAFHGGSRRSMELCIMCHTAQSTDPDTGNTIDMQVMTHKIHMGSQLPSVIAGKPYQIIGFGNSVSDWSTVVYPSDPRRCETCHQSTTGAAQADYWLKVPTRAACGSCHDDVNFATGANHVNLPQVTDNQCASCHIPQGELEFDASIRGAHTIPAQSVTRPGLVFNILSVDNGQAGKKPTVTFTMRDNSGAGILLSAMKTSPNRIGLVLAGPTTDYGFTSFGSDVTTAGYVSENPVNTGSCSSDGTCTYTFTHAIPATATGTFAIGIEGRRSLTLLPGTTQQTTTQYGATNKVFYFSVDGSTVKPRRTVVAISKCNSCHAALSLHGENRNQIEQCVLCHNSGETDKGNRVNATVAADKAAPPQAIQFAYMIHRIHTGEKMVEDGASYTIVGFGGSHNDFSDVRYPVFSNAGSVGDTAKCTMCHVNSSEDSFPTGKAAMVNPQGLINPEPVTTAACNGCHVTTPYLAHAVSQTDPKLGESCDVCHSGGADFDAIKEHAGK
jgi:OmcA/MtrC family decaheme c-type cytochrome